MSKMHWNLVALAVILIACAIFFRQAPQVPASERWSLTISRATTGLQPARRFTIFSDGKTISLTSNSYLESPVIQAEALPALGEALRRPELNQGSSASSQEVWEVEMDGTTRRLEASEDSPAFKKARAALQAAITPPHSGPEWWMSLSQKKQHGPWESRVFQVSYLGWATVTYQQGDRSWSSNVARIPQPRLQALYARFQTHPLDGSASPPDADYTLALMANRDQCVLVCPDGQFAGPAGQTQALLESCFPHTGRLLDQPWLAPPVWPNPP